MQGHEYSFPVVLGPTGIKPKVEVDADELKALLEAGLVTVHATHTNGIPDKLRKANPKVSVLSFIAERSWEDAKNSEADA
jgi:hypothetical protein